ncbi:NAD(P)-dependent oxidoreductase [Hyphomicrobium sp. 99]|uniref:NAD-dependent epimerase/dehydratase family protein n=1 Tax=Hyphomicrobium sp. 99 TaxID=1163419 RepID=UPI0018CF5D8B|nr:NAD-dependent epimerase/dehydratase family protein [Hyphomicrobium sp. 99]
MTLASLSGQRIFLTGATGFIGAYFLRAAMAASHEIDALTRSKSNAASLEAVGATAIVGDLTDSKGTWREALRKADAVIHLAQPQTFGGRLTKSRAKQYSVRRVAMDRALFEAIDPARTRRIVYVAGTSYYGDCGSVICDEGATPHPRGWGPYLAPAIESLPGYVARGLPIVAAFPGWVYGPGSWFAQYVLEPLSNGKPVYGLRGRARYTSPVHVEDCGRAILHLTQHSEIGSRYFIVDDEPVPGEQLAKIAANTLGVTGHGRKLPFVLLKLLVGQVVADSLAYENRLSNSRLKSTGFAFDFPSCEQGVPHAVRTWLQEKSINKAEQQKCNAE